MKKFVLLQIIALCAILIFSACSPDSPYTSLEVVQATNVSDSSARIVGIYDADGDTMTLQLLCCKDAYNCDTLFDEEVYGANMISRECRGLDPSTDYSYYLRSVLSSDEIRSSEKLSFNTLDPPSIMTHEDSVTMHLRDSVLRPFGFVDTTLGMPVIRPRDPEFMPNAIPNGGENTEPVEI